ncbi:hypothetical protein AVEN_67052-1 [Araneus ventricosus]|uniref:Uncharacterized protein n=1 Tax=Araneus ventricosus TaxID=182803 RepID=A0A4Y2HY59_ARAVE|nr:hypothetical protein AVEN_29358-1 [Araneus ventricosus]GBM70514.1 hypothetical protein AVEN_67052-1 [Araneus ventricosus]
MASGTGTWGCVLYGWRRSVMKLVSNFCQIFIYLLVEYPFRERDTKMFPNEGGGQHIPKGDLVPQLAQPLRISDSCGLQKFQEQPDNIVHNNQHQSLDCH